MSASVRLYAAGLVTALTTTAAAAQPSDGAADAINKPTAQSVPSKHAGGGVVIAPAAGVVIANVSWTAQQEAAAQISKPGGLLAGAAVWRYVGVDNAPGSPSKPKFAWVKVGTVKEGKTSVKNGVRRRMFTMAGLPHSMPVLIEATSADGFYMAQREIQLSPKAGKFVSLKLE